MAKGYKTGGRVKGTPNKVTSVAKQMAMDLLRYHSEDVTDEDGNTCPLIMRDFADMKPSDRVRVSVELIKAMCPKGGDDTQGGNTPIIELLASLTAR